MTSDTVHWLREPLVAGTLSRAALARELCVRDDWRNAKGELCAASARKALPRLAGKLGLAPGWRVSYLLLSPRHGILGGLSFVAAPQAAPAGRKAPRRSGCAPCGPGDFDSYAEAQVAKERLRSIGYALGDGVMVVHKGRHDACEHWDVGNPR